MPQKPKADTSNEKPWDITTERFVAYIDIMGFKDLVARTKHEVIYEMMKKIDARKKFNAKVKWVDETDSDLVTTTTYSDSLIIYSKDKTFESLFSLICTVSGLSDDLFAEGIPHKGALAFGTMTLDTERSIFFGQPLIDAYLLQEEIYFYGILVHATAEEKIDEFIADGHAVIFVKNYACNLKNGVSKNLTICPMYSDPTFILDEKYKANVDKLFSSIRKLRYKTSGHLRKYIDATEIYITKVQKNEI